VFRRLERMIELKMCPFCGSKVKIERCEMGPFPLKDHEDYTEGWIETKSWGWYVLCDDENCFHNSNADVWDILSDELKEGQKHTRVETWNSRSEVEQKK